MLFESASLDWLRGPLPIATSTRMPWPSAIILAVLFIAAGVVVAAVSRKLAGGTIDRNSLLGLRLPSTLRSDDAWHAGQRAFATYGVAAGAGSALLGASLLLRPSQGLAVTVASAASVWLVVLPAIGAFMGDLAAKET